MAASARVVCPTSLTSELDERAKAGELDEPALACELDEQTPWVIVNKIVIAL